MEIYHLDRSFPKLSPCLALGNFDGVHVAHRMLIEKAKAFGGKCAVFTFEHLRSPYLTSESQRLELLEECGADAVYLCDFDSVKNMSYTDFFNSILIEKIGISAAFCGFNFTFGNMARGKAEHLQMLCREHGLHCGILEERLIGSETVSSTAIRQLLAQGDASGAATMLGRPFSIEGQVVHGKALASRLGFPTLNIPVDSRITPLKKGVYFTRCIIDGVTYDAVSNYGVRPTFNDGSTVLETYLLDTSVDLYGKKVKVLFCAFSRDEQRFDSTDSLACAAKKDIEAARSYFNSHN